MSIPKVLIYHQTFNDFSGGGITLTNLFKGWPKDSIAVLSKVEMMDGISFEVCNTYYQLGKEENKSIFPLNLIQRKSQSGLKTNDAKVGLPLSSQRLGLRHKFVTQIFFPFMNWIGVVHLLLRTSMSQNLKDWLDKFKPDILYLQADNRDSVLFVKELCDYLKIPSAIHVMDDWPSKISTKGLFSNYWIKKIDKEYRELLDKVDIHLSICDAMSEEYKIRYNKTFIAFHNPIDVEKWLPYGKSDFTLNRMNVNVLYTGRIGIGITDSLLEVAAAIDQMNDEEVNIKLHIQTPSKQQTTTDLLQNFKCVVINPFVEYSQIPEITSKADILLLANDFSKAGINFLKFSMPTKVSEYMISGTPVLVYASDQTAVSKFFSQHKCGYCVTKQDKDEIIKAFQFLINNEEYRKKISRNAFNLAKDKFNAITVRMNFQHLLINRLKQLNSNMV
jgi:glycosyltransferase involved in cell wall biosynthesis